MLTPELIVYVWMFPFFMFFIFPFICLPIALRWKSQTASQASETLQKKLFAEESNPLMADDNRQDPRKETKGISAQVFTGNNSYTVAVNNISKSGICFGCSAQELEQCSDSLGMMLTESGKMIHMQIKPHWNQQTGDKQNIGASIINSQETWEEFANRMENAA